MMVRGAPESTTYRREPSGEKQSPLGRSWASSDALGRGGGRAHPIDGGRQLLLRPRALVVRHDPVAGIGEPHRPVGPDGDVVGRVEAAALVPVGEHRDRPVVLGPGDAAGAVLAGDEAALLVAGVAVGVLRGLPEDRDVAGPRVPAQHPVRRDVAEQQAVVVAEPDRSLDPAEARGDPLDGGVEHEVALEPRVEHAQRGVGIPRGGLAPAVRRQGRERHRRLSNPRRAGTPARTPVRAPRRSPPRPRQDSHFGPP